MNDFDYIIDRIAGAPFETFPFRHIYIENLFCEEHFARIIGSPEVNIGAAENDRALISELYRNNFKEIAFPGATTDIAAYLKWHGEPAAFENLNQRTCEGYGVTLRLQATAETTILARALAFLRSDRFWKAAASRFAIALADVRRDIGLQKYLDGYEISPHPDIRLKALTFMININPAPNAEDLAYHTHI